MEPHTLNPELGPVASPCPQQAHAHLHQLRAQWVKVQGSGFRVQGAGFRVQGSGCRVQGSGFRVQDFGSGVPHSGLHPFHQKSADHDAIDFRAKFGHVSLNFLREGIPRYPPCGRISSAGEFKLPWR